MIGLVDIDHAFNVELARAVEDAVFVGGGVVAGVSQLDRVRDHGGQLVTGEVFVRLAGLDLAPRRGISRPRLRRLTGGTLREARALQVDLVFEVAGSQSLDVFNLACHDKIRTLSCDNMCMADLGMGPHSRLFKNTATV